MIIRGKAWKFADYVSTDLIAPGRYSNLRDNMKEFVKHVLEDADPKFAPAALEGKQTYIVVGGRNFGQGSSREHAARLIKLSGVPIVLAKSFARIFYRNCFNIGMPALVADTDQIAQGDELEIDVAQGIVHDKTKGTQLQAGRIPPVMLQILNGGGIIEYIKKHGDLVFEKA
ncbi:MAG: 3-isopropylmalate dehydratase [Candidatus Fraserbacteria bacterium RBG_16_55_9]|uniref:3-isopropylmalate dehydratase small subunit n=1 Tax=Fraserbacteria sp. (strain RBG_16_55_9) TaxID=1817864 RepID=A0A1F5UWX8_FRAXR|nr:MAG: 3-isopropylmalate dehydratase [Candidatus Fraserbacteria bacterium RBG_16_55_9]